MIFDFLAVALPLAFCLLSCALSAPGDVDFDINFNYPSRRLPREKEGFSFRITFGNSCPTDFAMPSLTRTLSPLSLSMQNSAMSGLVRPVDAGPCIWPDRLARRSATHATCTLPVLRYYCPTYLQAACNPGSILCCLELSLLRDTS